MDAHSSINENNAYILDEAIPRAISDQHSVDAQGEKLLSLCKNNTYILMLFQLLFKNCNSLNKIFNHTKDMFICS